MFRAFYDRRVVAGAISILLVAGFLATSLASYFVSRQSLHDGERWIHEPVRLTVVVDAPRAAIDTVIGKHEVVRHLLDNGWLHLWRFEQAGFERYVQGRWSPVDLAGR